MTHPYYPQELVLPGYAAPVIPFQQVLAYFFTACGGFFVLTWVLTGRYKQLQLDERVTACWFAMTGMVHLFIEGYVVLHPGFHKDTTGGVLPEIWKEYSQADSRYVTRDSFVMSMEAVTAFLEGPACFIAVWAILHRKSWAYTLQILISCGQIYGDILYFATTALEGLVHARPEWQYFWFYFVIVNSFWIVVPCYVIFQAASTISKAVEANRRSTSKTL